MLLALAHKHTPTPIRLTAPQIWDLRKLKVVHDFSLDGKAISAINFDLSGSYFAAGSEGAIGFVVCYAAPAVPRWTCWARLHPSDAYVYLYFLLLSVFSTLRTGAAS